MKEMTDMFVVILYKAHCKSYMSSITIVIGTITLCVILSLVSNGLF